MAQLDCVPPHAWSVESKTCLCSRQPPSVAARERLCILRRARNVHQHAGQPPHTGCLPDAALRQRENECRAVMARICYRGGAPLLGGRSISGETGEPFRRLLADAQWNSGPGPPGGCPDVWPGQDSSGAKVRLGRGCGSTDLSQGHENFPGTLLPNLLPNSVARDGTRTDRGQFRDRKSQTIRDALGCLDTRRGGQDRISRPVPRPPRH